MNKIFNPKQVNIILLLLTMISCSSCSGEIHDFSDIFYGDSVLTSVILLSSFFCLLLVVYSILSDYMGVLPQHTFFDLDGKKHWLTTYKSVPSSTFSRAVEDGFIYFFMILPFVLGLIMQGMVLWLTGKVNIFIELFLLIACQYLSYKICHVIVGWIKVLYYLIIISMLIGLVGIIIYLIYVIGEHS